MGYSVGIVGGGAAGLTAAIAAAGEGANVTLMERNDRLGRKLLSTGNGRCNLGNEKLDTEEYYTSDPDILEAFLHQFGTEETKAFFRQIGLMIKSKNGYLYPVNEQAAAVLDVLRYEAAALGIRVITDCRIEQIEKLPGTRSLRVRENDKILTFDRVVLACGGKAAPKTGSDGSGYVLAEQLGHTLIPTVPALVQLRCRGDFFKSVAGVRADALLTVVHRGKETVRERGELQLTDYGISGIPVFQISRVVNYILRDDKETEIRINFLPDYTDEDFASFCAGRMLLQRERTVEEFFTGMLHKKLMLLFVKMAGLKTTEKISDADQEKVSRVYALCRCWHVQVTGSQPYENAQVCAGGVPLAEVTEHLESRKVSGVYFAGELLDVDGKCGGYNLQWAWCSGYLAGSAAARAADPGRELKGQRAEIDART